MINKRGLEYSVQLVIPSFPSDSAFPNAANSEVAVVNRTE